jgi:hypothetical protein
MGKNRLEAFSDGVIAILITIMVLELVRFDPVAGFSFAALTPWARLAVAPGSCVVSDGLLGFEVLERLGYAHKVVLAPRRRLVRQARAKPLLDDLEQWVPPVWGAIAKEAVRRIREITDRPRAFAHYVEEQLAARKKDPSSPLRFYRHASCPNVADDEPLTCEQAAAVLGCRGKKRPETWC